MKRKLLIALTASVLSASVMAAQDVVDFEDLDKNKDGYLTTQEAASLPVLKDSFARADTQKDDKLSKSEYRDFLKQAHGGAAIKDDQSGPHPLRDARTGSDNQQDGQVSASSNAGASGLPGFAQLDINKDGLVIETEYQAYQMKQARSGQVQGSSADMSTDAATSADASGTTAVPVAVLWLVSDKADANRDSQLSHDELLSEFKEADSDANNTLSQNELSDFKKELHIGAQASPGDQRMQGASSADTPSQSTPTNTQTEQQGSGGSNSPANTTPGQNSTDSE